MARARAAVLLAALAASFGPAAAAPASAADWGAIGELKPTLSFTGWRSRDTASEVITTTLTCLRLQLDGGHRTESGDLTWLAVYDNDILAGGLVKSPSFPALIQVPQPTYFDLHRQVTSTGVSRWTHSVSRASVAWETDRGRIIVGRQRVAWGSGRIWNPTDRFNPASPTGIDAGGKTGSDSILVERFAGAFGALQLVAAPGRGVNSVSRKLAVRWRDTIGETDYALLAGRIGDEAIAGLDLATNVPTGGLHLEATAGWPKTESRYVQYAAGYDTPWQPGFLDNAITLGIEYFRNTAATGRAPAALATDRLQSRRRHLVALSAGYDLAFLWRAAATALLDTEAGSRVVIPSVTWSASQNVDIQFLAQFYQGGPDSEYGAGQDAFLIRLTAYF
ncbi:MAG: hypothetical protein O2905_03310 [Proteobacteria bacterium]|nr:hypothetical protein [Pseudomonadota bacterium]